MYLTAGDHSRVDLDARRDVVCVEGEVEVRFAAIERYCLMSYALGVNSTD